MKIVATASLPAVDRPNADRWNAARSRQNFRFSLNMNGKNSLDLEVKLRLDFDLVVDTVRKKTIKF